MASLTPLLLPTSEETAQFSSAIRNIADKQVPVLVTGSNDAVHFHSEYQLMLLQQIFEQASGSSVLQEHATFVGSMAHCRAPPDNYKDCWYRRNTVFDNLIQETAFVACQDSGNVMQFVPILFRDSDPDKGYRFEESRASMMYAGLYPNETAGVLPVGCDLANSTVARLYENVPVAVANVPGTADVDVHADGEPFD